MPLACNKEHIYSSYNRPIVVSLTPSQFITLCTLVVNTEIRIIDGIIVTTTMDSSLSVCSSCINPLLGLFHPDGERMADEGDDVVMILSHSVEETDWWKHVHCVAENEYQHVG